MSDDDLRRAYDTAWPFPNAHLAGLRAVKRAARAAAFREAAGLALDANLSKLAETLRARGEGGEG